MSEVLKQPALAGAPELKFGPSSLKSYGPAALAVGGALLVAMFRYTMGGAHFISDGALMMLALASYMIAAVFYLLNIYAPAQVYQRIGLWGATAGVFFNLSSWLVRWYAAYDAETSVLASQGVTPDKYPWVFRYIPFANLYDLSLAFAFGAGITTLLIGHRKSFRSLAAFSLPLAAIILTLARFIGGDLNGLQPVLDSYWRPIHVGIASLSYGIALVCFAIAVVYLLKDGVKTEAMAVWTCVFSVCVIATVSRGSVLWLFDMGQFATYRASMFLGAGRYSPPVLRADIPYVGTFLVASVALMVGVVVAFLRYLSKSDEGAKVWGHRLLKAALVAQALAIGTLVYQVKNIADPLAHVNTAQYEQVWVALVREDAKRQNIPAAKVQETLNSFTPQERVERIEGWMSENGPSLRLSMGANPVEVAALITCLAATLFVVIFSFRTEKLRAALPPLEKIDSLMYKTAGVVFAGLALLLMTGAIWANESWGRYWGWDPKETGAFVAWLTYGAFLHTRLSRGWSGRASAYFALVAFLLVIFTYLGVSYLLPGLHSYA